MFQIPFPRTVSLVALIFSTACCLHAVEPLAQDHVVVWHNTDPEYYVEGPGLVRMDDGALLS